MTAASAATKGIIMLPEILRNTLYASNNALLAADDGNGPENKHAEAYELLSINRC